MACLLASTANLRALLGTVGLAVASLATATALASELALDGRIRAVSRVVARLVAVVAEARVGAFHPRLRAVTREMAFATAADKCQFRRLEQTSILPLESTHLWQMSPPPPPCLETLLPRYPVSSSSSKPPPPALSGAQVEEAAVKPSLPISAATRVVS